MKAENTPKFLMVAMTLQEGGAKTLKGGDARGLMDNRHRVELACKLMKSENKPPRKEKKLHECPKCHRKAS